MSRCIHHQDLMLFLSHLSKKDDMALLKLPLMPTIQSFLQSSYFAKPGKLQCHGELIQGLIVALCQPQHWQLLCDYTFPYFLQNLEFATAKLLPIEVYPVFRNDAARPEDRNLIYSDQFCLLAWYTAADAISRLVYVPWEAELAQLSPQAAAH